MQIFVEHARDLGDVGVPLAEAPDLAPELVASIIVKCVVLYDRGFQSARKLSLHVALFTLTEGYKRCRFDILLAIDSKVSKLRLGLVDKVDVDMT